MLNARVLPSTSSLRGRTAAARRVDEPAVRRSRARWRGRPHVVDEELFRDALLREQKRADRFDQRFALVLVAMTEGTACEGAQAWPPVVEALTAAKRDTDVLGWFERGTVIGLMAPEIDSSDSSAEELDSRVQRALVARLDSHTGVGFSVRSHMYSPTGPGAQACHPDGVPVLDPPDAGRTFRGLFKRALDLVFSLTLLAVLTPVFAVIALTVKLTSRGPVFFRQVRVGSSAKPFTMLKFRTMSVDADHAIHQQFVSQYINSTVAPSSGEAQIYKIVDDPRVTSVGGFLRKASLDELPQLFNVLKGDMSLVGPRPALPYEVQQYKRWHYRRVLAAKPGITGLWQVTGRSRTTFDEMVRLDLRYARNSSAWTDIKILLATPRAVISGKGAC